MIENEINEKYIIALAKSDNSNLLISKKITIDNSFKDDIAELVILCDSSNSTLNDLIYFLEQKTIFKSLTGFYKYCVKFSDSFQGFSANHNDKINYLKSLQKEFETKKNKILNNDEIRNKNSELKKFNKEKEKIIKDEKSGLKFEYIRWSKAYSIQKTYELCNLEKNILMYSHRTVGWSNPIYYLNDNLSVEIKTNFGYGESSYFYIKLTYKGILLLPFSDWIKYNFLNTYDIIRYSRVFQLENIYWYDAIDFCLNACNLSITNEKEFINKYIINECKVMVEGLAETMGSQNVYVRIKGKETPILSNNIHHIIKYKAEKISGALDFISKIIDLSNFFDTKPIIDKIANFNLQIQPILIPEINELKLELSKLKQEYNDKYEHYKKLETNNNQYINIARKMKLKIIQNFPEPYDTVETNEQFISEYPEYVEHLKELGKKYTLCESLSDRINDFEDLVKEIKAYNNKINNFFKNYNK